MLSYQQVIVYKQTYHHRLSYYLFLNVYHLFQGFSNLQTLSDLDETIMRLLYDKRLEIGMSEEEIRTALKN